MKTSVLLIVLCTVVVLAAQQGQAKKGCNAYGHACYGGHGKRSLGSAADIVDNAVDMEHIGADDMQRQEATLRAFPNEPFRMAIGSRKIDPYMRNGLMKIMEALFDSHSVRPSERINDANYPVFADNTNYYN